MDKELIEEVNEQEAARAAEQRKKVRRAVRRTILACVGGVCLLCTGYFLGVHHRVIEAYVKGEPLPLPPKGSHCPAGCLRQE